MSIQTVYIPHKAGTVLGSHYLQPWVADSVAQAAAAPWQGQPVFTSRAEAFAWLELARAGTFRLLDLAVARVDADTFPEPDGQRRVRLDRAALVAPHAQVVRADADSPGPNVSVLNALYAGVHEDAYHRRERSRNGYTARDPATDVANLVWRLTYPIAYRDAATVLTERVGRAARQLLGDPDPRLDLDDASRAGLAALSRAAAGTDGTDPQAPAPGLAVVDDAVAVASDERRGGWRHAVDRVWAQALVTAAADGLITTATALTTAWNSHRGDAPAPPAADAIENWLRRTLADTTQTVLSEWLHVAGHHPTRPAPAAARAYPQLTNVSHASTADASAPHAPVPVTAAAALPSGRGR